MVWIPSIPAPITLSQSDGEIHISDDNSSSAQKHTRCYQGGKNERNYFKMISASPKRLISILRNAAAIRERLWCVDVLRLRKQPWIPDWYHLFAISPGGALWDWTMWGSGVSKVWTLKCDSSIFQHKFVISECFITLSVHYFSLTVIRHKSAPLSLLWLIDLLVFIINDSLFALLTSCWSEMKASGWWTCCLRGEMTGSRVWLSWCYLHRW